MNKISKAALFAQNAHKSQKYGDRPYIYHLIDTAATARTIGADEDVIAACCLHDVLEDTPLSYNDVKKEFGERIADIVYAVTDELGKNRKERKERTFGKIRANPDAILVKLCDRIANMRNAKYQNQRMYTMYLDEYESFLKELDLDWLVQVSKPVSLAVEELSKLAVPLEFNDWYDLNESAINIELAENGADREMDFNPEAEFDKRYQKYLSKHEKHLNKV